MRLLVLTVWDFTNSQSDGICKKLLAQIHNFTQKGWRTDFTYIREQKTYFDCNKKEICLGKNYFGGKFAAYKRIYSFLQKRQNHYDCVYIRYAMADYYFIRILREFKKKGSHIVVEIPTYPYDSQVNRGILDQINLFSDRLFRKKMYGYAERIAAITELEQIYKIPVLQISNGIDFEKISVRTRVQNKDGIHLVAVSSMAKWHGYERLLEGMKLYSGKEKRRAVYLHFVGTGPEYAHYTALVRQYSLTEYVHFHGSIKGKELDNVYNQCDIGIDCLAIHRIGIHLSSSLKAKEYAAKGLPIVTSCKLDTFPVSSTDFILPVPEDESPIEIENVVEFYDKVYSGKGYDEVVLDIRRVAQERCSIEKAMENVTRYFGEVGKQEVNQG